MAVKEEWCENAGWSSSPSPHDIGYSQQESTLQSLFLQDVLYVFLHTSYFLFFVFTFEGHYKGQLCHCTAQERQVLQLSSLKNQARALALLQGEQASGICLLSQQSHLLWSDWTQIPDFSLKTIYKYQPADLQESRGRAYLNLLHLCHLPLTLFQNHILSLPVAAAVTDAFTPRQGGQCGAAW